MSITNWNIYYATEYFNRQMACSARFMVVHSYPCPDAYVFDKKDIQPRVWRSRRDYPGNWYLWSKCCGNIDSKVFTDVVLNEYRTVKFTFAALKKICDAFDAGLDAIELPREGQYEPFKK